MVLESYATVKSKVISLENQINYLSRIHKGTYSEIKSLRQKKNALEEKLHEMEYEKNSDIFLGLTSSIELSYRFADLLAKEKTYEKIRVMLQQQLEQAQIKQEKNFAPLYLVDEPMVPEYKCKPSRSLVTILIVGIYMFVLCIGILLWEHFSFLQRTHPEKLDKMRMLASHLTTFRKRQ
jgi:uncharacterized protein involved in exopolysaccharide biosynthesis